MKKTFSLKKEEVSKSWLHIDAKDLVVGRLASYIANLIRGKHKPLYTPHVDCGDIVVVTNASKVRFTGLKLDNKQYYWHTGYPGGIKQRSAKEIINSRNPERVLYKAVSRMVPKNPLGRRQMLNLYLYNESSHPHAPQRPVSLNFAKLNRKNSKQ